MAIMDVVLLHKRSAGEGEWTRASLLRLLRRHGFRARYYPIADALAAPDVLKDGEFVAVAGGDGSIRKTALRLLGRGRPIAPLPIGTANNIAGSLGLPLEPEKVVAGWKRARRVPFDVGLVSGPFGRKAFIEAVGVGLISRTIRLLDTLDAASVREIDGREDQLLRDTCVTITLASEMPPVRCSVQVDRGRSAGNYLLLEVLNIRRAGPGFELAPKANPSDGRFEIVRVDVSKRRTLLRALTDRLAEKKRPLRLPSRRAQRVRLRVPPGTLRIDDKAVELARRTTLDISVLPGALEFVLPG